VRTGTDEVFLLASDEKWKKGKDMILEMMGVLLKAKGSPLPPMKAA
jgi:hypothetical protein